MQFKQGLFSAPCYYYEQTTSTIDEARQKIATGSVDSGSIIIAAYQTAGKGQRGRSWIALPRQSLMCTLVLDTNMCATHGIQPLAPSVFTLCVANAIVKIIIALSEEVDRISACTSMDTSLGAKARSLLRIRWPNDILIGDKKVAGILTEVFGEWVLLSFGINFIAPSYTLMQELAQETAYRQMEAAGLDSLGIETDIEQCYTRLCIQLLAELQSTKEEVLSYTTQMLWQKEKRVLFCAPQETTTLEYILNNTLTSPPSESHSLAKNKDGYYILVGIDAHGALVLQDDKGNYHTKYSGSIRKG